MSLGIVEILIIFVVGFSCLLLACVLFEKFIVSNDDIFKDEWIQGTKQMYLDYAVVTNFTYLCGDCGFIHVELFSDKIAKCPMCDGESHPYKDDK